LTYRHNTRYDATVTPSSPWGRPGGRGGSAGAAPPPDRLTDCLVVRRGGVRGLRRRAERDPDRFQPAPDVAIDGRGADRDRLVELPLDRVEDERLRLGP